MITRDHHLHRGFVKIISFLGEVAFVGPVDTCAKMDVCSLTSLKPAGFTHKHNMDSFVRVKGGGALASTKASLGKPANNHHTWVVDPLFLASCFKGIPTEKARTTFFWGGPLKTQKKNRPASKVPFAGKSRRQAEQASRKRAPRRATRA